MAFAGACQYRVGDYLSRYQYKDKPWQWQKVVGGEPSQEWIDILDNKMADIIDSHKNSSTLVRLLYSTEEHTYPEHIIPLIKKLDENGISHYDQIEKFNNHSMIGPFFRDAIKRYFNE